MHNGLVRWSPTHGVERLRAGIRRAGQALGRHSGRVTRITTPGRDVGYFLASDAAMVRPNAVRV